MGPLQKFQIVLDKPQPVYQPGEVMTGQLIVELNQEIKMKGLQLIFDGTANVRWTETTGDVEETYYSRKCYFHREMILFGKAEGEPETIHPKGCHTYPFEFTLPENLPSSFEGTLGRVRYWIKGMAILPWKRNHYSKIAFSVASVVDLNRYENIGEPQEAEGEKNICCLCCESGPISAVLHLEKVGFVPGEYIIVSGEITNHSDRKMSSSSMELRMTIVYRAAGKTNTHTKVISKLTKGKLPAGRSKKWTKERLPVPPVPPSNLPFCGIIDVHYNVVMIVDPSGASYDLEIPVKIIVGTVPLREGRSEFATSRKAADRPTDQQGPTLSYAESLFGKVDIHEWGDRGHTWGGKNWAPLYPYYS